MNFKTVSAILQGHWLIDAGWLKANLPLIVQLLEGKNVSFVDHEADADDDDGDDIKETFPRKITAYAAANVYGVRYRDNISNLPQGSIAVVDIVGPVTKYGGMCSYGSVHHAELISKLANSPNVEGVILNMDTPGGQAAGTANLAASIKAATNKKPVYAVIDDGIAASAGMWIASPASKIFVTQKTDRVGSIGAYTTIADFHAYFRAQGLPIKDVYSRLSSEKNDFYRESISGNDDLLKDELDDLVSSFHSAISTNRAGKLTSDAWKTGKLFNGTEAKKIGLIDGIKSFADVVDEMSRSAKKQRSQSNNISMDFKRTYAAAGFAAGETPEILNEGIWLSRDQMAAIEAVLGKHETDLQSANQRADEAGTNLTTAQETIGNLNGEVQRLTGEVSAKDTEITKLQGLAAGGFSQTTKSGGDEIAGSAGKQEFVSETTRQAREMRKLAGLE